MELQQVSAAQFGTLQFQVTRVTAAQLLDIGNTPIRVCDEPINGVRIPLWATALYVPGAADFTNPDSISVTIDIDSAGDFIGFWADPFLTDQTRLLRVSDFLFDAASNYATPDGLQSTPLFLRASAAHSYAVGDGSVVITVAYIVIPLSE